MSKTNEELRLATNEISSKIREKQLEIEHQDHLIEEIEEKKREIRNEIVQLKHQLNGLPIGINALPDEVLWFIWENFLDFHCLQRCQRVCVRWFHAIRSQVRSLVIYHQSYWRELDDLKGQRWFHSGRLINTNLSIAVQRMRFKSTYSDSPYESKFLVNLKRLHLTAKVDRPLWELFAFINHLDSLEELELSSLWTESERPIHLPIRARNLKYIFIKSTNVCVNLVVQSKIVRLKTYDRLYSVRLNYPEELREVELMTQYGSEWCEQSYKNCEVFKSANGITDESLEKLIEHSVGLKQLYLGLSADLTHYQAVKANALKALRLKEAFNRSELEIVFYGMRLKNEEELSGVHFDADYGKLIKLLMKNYPKLVDDLGHLHSINYRHLIESVGGQIPSDFHRKFTIKTLQVHGRVRDQDQLLTFLRNCKQLESLSIEDASLDEHFYSEINFLPIKKLKIDETANKFGNFSFILQLKKLECFEANLGIPLLQRGVGYLRGMLQLEGNQRRRSIKIERNPHGLELTIDGDSIHRKTYTATQLLEILATL